MFEHVILGECASNNSSTSVSGIYNDIVCLSMHCMQDHSGVGLIVHEVKPEISQTFEHCTSCSSENPPQLLPTFRLVLDE